MSLWANDFLPSPDPVQNQLEWPSKQRGRKDPSSWVHLDFECATSAAHAYNFIFFYFFSKPSPHCFTADAPHSALSYHPGSAQWMLKNNFEKNQFSDLYIGLNKCFKDVHQAKIMTNQAQRGYMFNNLLHKTTTSSNSISNSLIPCSDTTC